MGTVRTVHGNGMGHFEPVLTHQLLRGCACGSPHPIALRSPNPTICPGCGAPAAPPGAAHTEPSLLTGWTPGVLIGRLFLTIGKALAGLARSI